MKIRIKTIQWALSCFIVLWLNAGNFEYIQHFFPQTVKFGFVVLWFVLTSFIYGKFFQLYFRKAAPILFMIAIIFLSNAFGQTRYYRLYWMNYLYYAIIFGVFICCYYFYSNQESLGILAVLMVDITIVAVHTQIELMRNPILVRAMSTGMDAKLALLNGVIPVGVGGYGMCYQLVFYGILLVLLLYKYPQYRIWIYLFEALIFFELFSSQITLALIFQAVGVFSVLLVKRDRKGLALKFMLLVACVMVYLNMDSILQYLIANAGNELSMRLQELMTIREISIESSGDIATRYRLYWQSFASFLQNPFWGDFGGESIGCHSSFLDLLGAFGILGVAGIIGFLRPIQLLLKNVQLKNVRHYILLCYLMMLVLSSINVSIGSDILLAASIMVPMFFKVVYIREDS